MQLHREISIFLTLSCYIHFKVKKQRSTRRVSDLSPYLLPTQEDHPVHRQRGPQAGELRVPWARQATQPEGAWPQSAPAGAWGLGPGAWAWGLKQSAATTKLWGLTPVGCGHIHTKIACMLFLPLPLLLRA